MGKAKARCVVSKLLWMLACSFCWSAEPGYVGSKACAGCHPAIYRSYMETSMGRSMSLGSEAGHLQKAREPISVLSSKLKRQFRVFKQDGSLYQSESEAGVFSAAHKIEYAIGSGVNGWSFAVRRGDHLFQAPLSFYSRAQKWDLSPGYEFADYGFNRPLHAACIACHSGRSQPVANRSGEYGNPPFLELAIGCENCHGPGQLHASAPQKASGAIVNPAKLPARLAEDICMNCHQGGDSRVLQPGKDYSDFRPGNWLDDTVAIFKIPPQRGGSENSDLLEHHSGMKLSLCYRASAGKLSCLTCHNPHKPPLQAEAAAYYRGRCFTCHSNTSCGLPLKQRLPANDCAGCHMPKRDVTTISHSALTNHRITGKPGQPLPEIAFEPSNDPPDLIHLNRPPNSNRKLPLMTLLQAYGELMEKRPEYQQRYLALLELLGESEPKNPLIQAALGRKALREAKSEQALLHLSQAMDSGSQSSSVYQDLGEVLARLGRFEEAAKVLQSGIAIHPYNPVLYKSLALQLINLKRYPTAKQTMERYVELFPEDDFMRNLLSKVQTSN